MNNPITDPQTGGYVTTVLGILFIASIVCADQYPKVKNSFETIKDNFQTNLKPIQVESFGNDESVQTQQQRERFYNQNPAANRAMGTQKYGKPNGNLPNKQQTINLNSSGDQLLSYQIYQQAVNAATPTEEQLKSISGQSQEQTGKGAIAMGGGLSEETAPYDILNGNLYDSEYQAVNLANERAQKISACAQNAPTFCCNQSFAQP